jgi:SAM-dependent methyltransferase
VEGLLTPRLSALEADLIAGLLRLGPRDVLLDLACGQGRHARLLAGRVGCCVGLERSAQALRGAAAEPSQVRWLRADLRWPPLRDGSFDAVLSWYASLFMWDDAGNAAALVGLARLLRPGGRLLVQHANPLALALAPVASATRRLADGSRVEERSEFDAVRGVDRMRRRLVEPGGATLEAVAELRYYRPPEWEPLARRAGLRLRALTCSTPSSDGPPGHDAPDLIALLEKP